MTDNWKSCPYYFENLSILKKLKKEAGDEIQKIGLCFMFFIIYLNCFCRGRDRQSSRNSETIYF